MLEFAPRLAFGVRANAADHRTMTACISVEKRRDKLAG
jgi:hypothetical protein